MRAVIWTDPQGYRHRSLVRDEDADAMAPHGILQDPPDLDDLDWDAVKRDLHNALVDMGLSTWDDVQRQGGALRGAIFAALKRRLIGLYRLREKPPEPNEGLE